MSNKYKKILFLCLLLIGCAVTSALSSYDKGNIVQEENFIKNPAVLQENKQAVTTIKVYISGAVKNPGIYDIQTGARVDAAVAAAGGFTDFADLEKVNLVKKLKDGSHVNVPMLNAKKLKARQEYVVAGTHEYGRTETAETINKVNGKISINTASAEELELLPGVGKATAQNIIEYRSKNRFTSIEDIMLVKGIGKAKFAKMRDRISI